ncbi:hypothetical protein MUK42_19492 [Musa troglodytarum]|uniref:Plastid movement impaired 2 n=3 Tax=Musa troglodytarum TaxID=320322 RepID=A0A9E7GB72_9LILI|nr:hypothetical protein MUK42_19492 [Musa troglodytarum]
MGNGLSGRKRIITVMKIDGTTLKLKAPVQAEDLLRDYPGYDLLESEAVKQLGVGARPLAPDAPMHPGKLYFLVQLPRAPEQRALRTAWSGGLRVSARERLENLAFTRRTMSDVSVAGRPSRVEAEEGTDGTVRLRLRIPKAEMEKLLQESKNDTEAAEKIMVLCVAKKGGAPNLPAVETGHKEVIISLNLLKEVHRWIIVT